MVEPTKKILGIAIPCLMALLWSPASGAERAAAASPTSEAAEEREVSFVSGAVELRGTLLLPAGMERAPAVVFLHGSGPTTREGARPYAERFAELGIASLFYDKRGTGASGGSWLTASLDDLAGDALAAASLLEEEDRIDPERIGFWGVSQAGWVAARAAARSSRIGFLVLISGGGASPLESEWWSYRRAFDEAGLAAGEIVEAEALLEAYFSYLATGEGRRELVDRIGRAEQEPWYRHAAVGRILPSEENRENWSWVATYDPAPDLAGIRAPALLLFGAEDANHPTELAVRRWREGLRRAGNEGFSIVVFPEAGHGIRRRAGHEGPGRAPFADGYAEVMIGWLWLHVLRSS